MYALNRRGPSFMEEPDAIESSPEQKLSNQLVGGNQTPLTKSPFPVPDAPCDLPWLRTRRRADALDRLSTATSGHHERAQSKSSSLLLYNTQEKRRNFTPLQTTHMRLFLGTVYSANAPPRPTPSNNKNKHREGMPEAQMGSAGVPNKEPSKSQTNNNS